jgi:hypothetical protein
LITYAEFFLFIGLIAAIAYGIYWKHEAAKWHFLFKLMLTNEEARSEIINNYDEFKRQVG